MAANRKLLTEIQQVLKKYEEGVVLFDDIWEKVYAAEQQSLKEKYESDLKKEIKKLQRLRDQIKTWISSSEIKDKSQLLEARKVIESKMEQFKICEKDTKTKAYSKEGLARDSKLDPKEALKEEKRGWINDCLEKLSDFIDAIEADKEKILNAKGKGKSSNRDQIERFENRIQKHKWHMAKLELIIKLMESDELDPALLDGVKDSLDYYLESAVDDDGEVGIEDEFDIYEELELDSMGQPAIVPAIDAGDATDTVTAKKSTVTTGKVITGVKSVSTAAAVTQKPTPLTLPAATGGGKTASGNKHPAVTASASATLGKKAPALTLSSNDAEATGLKDDDKNNAISAPVSTDGLTPAISKVHTVTSSSIPNSWAQAASLSSTAAPSTGGAPYSSPAVAPPAAVASTGVVKSDNVANNLEATGQPTEVGKAEVVQPEVATKKSTPIGIVDSAASAVGSKPPSTASYKPELLSIVNLLTGSCAKSPEPLESEKSASYEPRHPQTHSIPCFPTTPLFTEQEDVAEHFERLPVDSLFFIFYFQQGTYQQHLAAKQLKRRSWRFHKKHMTWFQRHEEPKIATEEFEQGTYVYFDYESGIWSQRIKNDFKFEYCFLEDELRS